MAILWMTLAVAFGVSLFSRYLAVPSAIGPVLIRPNKLMGTVAIIILALVSGLRNNIGDTMTYMYVFKNTNFTWDYVKSHQEKGFSILQMVLKHITENPQILVFTTAIITNVLILFVLYKYSRLFELSIYIYITSGLYIVSMNGIRQFLAAAIFFAATQYLFEGNWRKYMAVVFLASTIHQSALILIPFYFVVRRKAWTGATLLILLLALLFALGYAEFSTLFFSAIADSHYSEYKNFNEGGANFIRVIVQAVPTLFAFLGRKKLSEIFPNSDYVVNMSIIGIVFMVIATQNWIFARFTIYFGLYNVILASWIVKLFAERHQKLVYYAILFFYFVYFYYENVVSLGLIYGSNYLKMGG